MSEMCVSKTCGLYQKKSALSRAMSLQIHFGKSRGGVVGHASMVIMTITKLHSSYTGTSKMKLHWTQVISLTILTKLMKRCGKSFQPGGRSQQGGPWNFAWGV